MTDEQCTKRVHNDGRSVGFHRCTRKAWKDGFCKQHHPNTEKARREKSDKKYAIESRLQSIRWGIQKLKQDCVKFVLKMAPKNETAAILKRKIETLEAERDKLTELLDETKYG